MCLIELGLHICKLERYGKSEIRSEENDPHYDYTTTMMKINDVDDDYDNYGKDGDDDDDYDDDGRR